MSRLLFWVTVFFISIRLCAARDLGTIGHVWPVTETDFLTLVQQRLQAFKQEHYSRIKTRIQQHSWQPLPVKHLSTTTTAHVFFYNPAFIVTHTITDGQGHIVAKAGEEVNPLTYIPCHETLLFLNAADKRQLLWAKKTLLSHPSVRQKVILTGGDLRGAAKALRQRVYFDQGGALTHRLRLVHVPDRIACAGKRLKVTEVAMKAAAIKTDTGRVP